MTPLLYLITILIWGSTWIAITWQIGAIPIEVSVLYRFVLATLTLFTLLALLRRPLRLPAAGHPYAMALGALLFSTNFICFYHATRFIPSGLSAVVFASASIFNGLLLWALEAQRPTLRWAIGALLGVCGTLLLFWPQLHAEHGASPLLGLLLACTGTLCFCGGNLVSARGQRAGYPVLTLVPWGMLYGVILLVLWVLIKGEPLVLPSAPRYLAGLVYLALFGSVVAFCAYLTLVGRIGAANAAYATVLFPVVALTLSALYEGYQWQTTAWIGMACALLGNLILFAPRRLQRHRSPS